VHTHNFPVGGVGRPQGPVTSFLEWGTVSPTFQACVRTADKIMQLSVNNIYYNNSILKRVQRKREFNTPVSQQIQLGGQNFGAPFLDES